MIKIKITRDLNEFNLSGYGKEFLTAKKDEMLELKDAHATRLIKMGLAVFSNEPALVLDPKPEPEPESDNKVYELSAETIIYLKGFDKDILEVILRKYDVEVDRRHALDKIRKELIKNVSSSIPEEVDGVDSLIKFYGNNFHIYLSKDTLSRLTANAGAILTQAFEDEDS